MKDVEEWLEEQRHNLFTCFECGRFGKADESIVLDSENDQLTTVAEEGKKGIPQPQLFSYT